MLEKKRNSKIKATIAVFMACIMLFGMSAFATVIRDSNKGLIYVWTGTYRDGVLFGSTESNCNTSMLDSYSLVELTDHNGTKYTVRKRSHSVSRSIYVGTGQPNLKVYHSVGSQYTGSSYVGAGGYTIY